MNDTFPRLRQAAAAAAGVVAVLYILTGTGWVAMSDGQEPRMIPPLLVGAVVFGALRLLVNRRPRGSVFVVGAALQVPALLLYLAVAPERTPPYELWRLSIKALQLFLLGAFVWLAVQPSRAARRPRRGTPQMIRDPSTPGGMRTAYLRRRSSCACWVH